MPKTFYVGKNGKIYVVFQQYEIGPYAAGFMVAEVGELKKQ
ncbi:RsiV family protein [Dialister sp.]